MATSPVLDITTDVVRQHVDINGRPYDLRAADDLTLTEFRQVSRLVPRIFALMTSEDPVADTELADALDEICHLALIAPDAVIAKLRGVNSIQVFTVFTKLLTPRLLAAGASLTADLLGGTRRSRGSSGSTVAPRNPGSRRRRSA